MIIDLNELNYKKEITLDIDVFKNEDLDERVVDLKDSKLKGIIYTSGTGEIIVDLVFKGIMMLNDSVTLELVEYPFDIKICDNLATLGEEFVDIVDFDKNTLDIFRLLWENIVLEVPISYTTSKDASMSGNGWELKNDDDTSDECDPRLEKLKELLKGDD